MVETVRRIAVDWAPYMHWSKVHPKVRWELSGSNLLPCTLSDLPGAAARFELNGPNDEGYGPLVEAIASHYGVKTPQVCTAAGASGANFLAIAALACAGDEVLIERPGYDPHAGAARLLGASVGTFERAFEDGWRIDPERIEAAVTSRTRLLVVTNPHNPSGILASDDDLAALGRLAEAHDLYVLVDEVYLDAAPSPAPHAVHHSDRMVSTSSLTKSYGLSGLRSGWAVASPELAEAMRRVRDVVDAVSAFPSDTLALLAFERLDELRDRAAGILGPNRSMLSDFMSAQPDLEWVVPSGGAVAFPRVRGLDDTGSFMELLRSRYEVGLVPGSFFGTPEHFRIALGGDGEVLAGGLEALGTAFADRAWEV